MLNPLAIMLDVDALFPSVVPRSYLIQLGEGACSYLDLGPNLIVMLSLDLGSAVRNVTPNELEKSGISDDEAWAKAMGNLGAQLSGGQLKVGVGEFDDGGKAIFLDGHWLASAAIFHNGFYQWFSEQLGSDSLCALISERDSAVIFAEDCSALVSEKIESFISRVELESRKPFGRNLFTLAPEGPVYVG
ncbi:hypothetical protein NU688_31500 [Variovorax sp. ZS18.2.2]|uniref:hypothetical protein n=1 Tax=Variovorax sp. ZS18.2.2 TaxID=2971255 RepID=UPI002150731B|nr:hypothetical protein [Variovorax sp. ZS18.2.2]MCR6480717.1 hypothetical protein [Variovorax sp. ZS18.2.2]